MLISDCCNADVILKFNTGTYKCDICGNECDSVDEASNHGSGIILKNELDSLNSIFDDPCT